MTTFLVLLFLASCQPTRSDFEQAVFDYYLEVNTNTGGGNLKIGSVTILEIDKAKSRFKSRLEGSYSNASLPNGIQNSDEQNVLWFIYKKHDKQIKIVGIRARFEP